MSNQCKYYKQKKQYSTDGGFTWQDVVPAVYQKGELYEYDSDDCRVSPYSKEYLTFIPISGSSTFGWEAPSASTASANTVYYSLDSGSTWSSLSSGQTVTVSQGNKIFWKATDLTATSGSGVNGIGRFTSTDNFDVEGNIMSLVSGDSFENVVTITNDNQFRGLFFSTKVENAENLILPATALTDSCYQEMFVLCSSLTTAPELPATTLAYKCYQDLFSWCTALTTAPSILPATTLEVVCYRFMFYHCESLTTAPELPATTLAQQCYADMFNGCTSLTTAPSILPATTLALGCYANMFQGCTSLTTAPVLPAETLESNCYGWMFYNCSSLNYIKCLATDISASNCVSVWVANVAANGTFVKAASMNDWPINGNGIPSGWTIVNA